MADERLLFTSEQVSNGHPDKICDQISDSIVTQCLQSYPESRAGIECMIKDYQVIIAGELRSTFVPDYEKTVRRVLRGIGLADAYKYDVKVFVSEQSPDIAQGVDRDGAGDQGMMFGYATDETAQMMPLPFVLATHALLKLKSKQNPLLLPDAKSQVTFDYGRNRIDTFLISTQHTEEAKVEEVRNAAHQVMLETANDFSLNQDFKVLVNPTGRFVVGSSFADSGLTGRKIIADSYGGMCRHGGGAFSGKDPTKVDRSAAYMARKIALGIVRTGRAKRCEVQLAYAIGVAEPVSLFVECFGTNTEPAGNIQKWVRKTYDMTPKGIISSLNLREFDYNKVSAYGHFGKADLPWEME